MTTWNKEKKIEEVNEMLIEYEELILQNTLRYRDIRGKILQHIRSLIDLAEVSGELTGMRQKQ